MEARLLFLIHWVIFQEHKWKLFNMVYHLKNQNVAICIYFLMLPALTKRCILFVIIYIACSVDRCIWLEAEDIRSLWGWSWRQRWAVCHGCRDMNSTLVNTGYALKNWAITSAPPGHILRHIEFRWVEPKHFKLFLEDLFDHPFPYHQ